MRSRLPPGPIMAGEGGPGSFLPAAPGRAELSTASLFPPCLVGFVSGGGGFTHTFYLPLLAENRVFAGKKMTPGPTPTKFDFLLSDPNCDIKNDDLGPRRWIQISKMISSSLYGVSYEHCQENKLFPSDIMYCSKPELV